MICVSVLYPSADGTIFDHDYYAHKHIPLAIDRLRDLGMKRCEFDRGLGGGRPGTPPPFLAAARLYFETLEEFQEALTKHGPELLADVPNYTNAQPVMQISETSVSLE